MDSICRQTALPLLVLGLLGWVVIPYIGGPDGSDPIGLSGPIAFDPVWALVAGTSVALTYGVAGLLKPRLVD